MFEKLPAVCYDCGEKHPSNYKSCKDYPMKLQFRESYTNIPKKKDMSKKDEVKNVTKNKVEQPEPKMAPSASEQLYQLEEFENGFTKLTEILDKIKV